MFEITPNTIDVDRVVEAVRHDEDGGVVTFVGVVRNENRGKQVLYLEYEAYPEMALGTMRQIGQEVADRWGLGHLAIIHRTGRIEVGEASVVIAVAAAEAAVGLAIVLAFFRVRKSVRSDEADLLRN